MTHDSSESLQAGPEIPPENLPEFGKTVETGCGSRISFCPETLYVRLDGEFFFFCLPACREDFLSDPGTSCHAARFFGKQ